MVDEGRGLVMAVAVAAGAADALAVGGERPGEGKPGPGPAADHVLQRLGVDRLHDPVDRGLRDRLAKPRLRVPPGADGGQLLLRQRARELRGGEAALHVRELGEDVHGEHAGHRVLAALRPAEVGDPHQLGVQGAHRPGIPRRQTGTGGRRHVRRQRLRAREQRPGVGPGGAAKISFGLPWGSV